MSYIFGEGTPYSYDDMKRRRRRVAEELAPKRDPFSDSFRAVTQALTAPRSGGSEAPIAKDVAPEKNMPTGEAFGGAPNKAGGLDPRLSSAWGAFSNAAREAGHEITVNSGFRSPDHQARIIADNWHKFDLNPADRDKWLSDVKAMGPVEAGRKWEGVFTNAKRTIDGSGAPFRNWIALPGSSQHQRGMALDLAYSTPEARQWAHQNAQDFGMTFPLSNEPWHIELIGGRAVAVGDVSGQPITPTG